MEENRGAAAVGRDDRATGVGAGIEIRFAAGIVGNRRISGRWRVGLKGLAKGGKATVVVDDGRRGGGCLLEEFGPAAIDVGDVSGAGIGHRREDSTTIVIVDGRISGRCWYPCCLACRKSWCRTGS